MKPQESRDFRRKNYFAIPCFYDSHLHLQGLGKFAQSKTLSSLKSFEDIKTHLISIPRSDKSVEGFGLPKKLTVNLEELSEFLNICGFNHFNLYWVLEDGHQLLVYGDMLLKFKAYLSLSPNIKSSLQNLLNSSSRIWIFDDSTRSVFDEYYAHLDLKSEATSMETHFLAAQNILLNSGVTHCRDLTSSLEQIKCLDMLYKRGDFHLYTETFFSDFFGDSFTSLVEASNEAIEFLNFTRDSSVTPSLRYIPGKTTNITSSTTASSTNLSHKGVKIFLDGTFSQGTVDLTCFHRYVDSSLPKPCSHGQRKYSVSDIVCFLRVVSKNNLDIAFHAMGDGAVEMILKAFDEVKSDFRTKLNLEHCEVINKPTMSYLSKLKSEHRIKLAFHFQPSHYLMDLKTLTKLKEQANDYYFIFAWAFLKNLGYNVHFGSDAPVARTGLRFMLDPHFNSFFRSEYDLNLFWSTFTHPDFKSFPNTFTLFEQSHEVRDTFINSQKVYLPKITG